MNWKDEGIILHIKSHNDHDAILTLFTKGHGLHRGFYKSSRSSRKGHLALQIGQYVDSRWYARLQEQLGSYAILHHTPLPLPLWQDAFGIHLIGSMCSLLAMVLPEKQVYPQLYARTYEVLCGSYQTSSQWIWIRDYVLWEMTLLQQLGFGLELGRCAVSQVSENLAYVSPKTGRAVTYDVGRPYHDKLLALPTFMVSQQNQPTFFDLHHGLCLTGYFIENWLLSSYSKKMPFQRDYLSLKIAEAMQS